MRSYFGTKVEIWTDTGTLLASQNVPSVPGTWVETPLSTPIQLTAGSHYRVAAYTASGTYYWRTDLGGTFPSGTIDQSYERSGDAFPTNTDTVRWWLVDLRYTVLTSSGGDGIGSLNGSGNVNLGPNFVDSFGTGSHTYDGVISGSGIFDVIGSGLNYTLNGNNTYTGQTYIYDGVPCTVTVNGLQPQSQVYVGTLATLGGSGTVGTITANGSIAPGISPGILNSGSVAFSPTGNFTVELTGPNPGVGGYDQLNVTGTASLANATLTVVPAFTTPVAIGQQFVILNNDFSDAITGTFSGLAEGATITAGGYNFTISYVGGTGNDVMLTLISIPGEVASSAVTAGDGSHGIDPNECDNLALVITNTAGSPMTGINATLSTTTEGVLITQPYAPYPDIPANGSGTNLAPFQISTLTNFACGTPINLQLSVDSSFGPFTMNYTLNTGESVAPLRYDVTGNVSIPDVGSVDSTNVVSGFSSTPLQKVVVSLYITHPFDSDLTNISLISPDGTTVLLSSANGGGGANYGSALIPDSNRTTFDDAAATAITAGTAPFVGTYRPQSALAAFINNVTPNGSWHLHIADGFGGSLGTLRGWSLFLYGTTCNTGSGACDVCLPPISDAITLSSPVQTNRWDRDGITASCGSPKNWDGFGDTGPGFHYNVYVFTNTSGADACVSVKLQSTSAVMAATYLNSYDPTTIANNYLADSGFSTDEAAAGTTTYSAEIPNGARFVVVVNEVYQGAGTQPYTLTLSGLPCPPPTLNIQPVAPSQARLYWDTSAGGYVLESVSNLQANSWGTVTNEPIVIGANYNVTNSSVMPTNRFYRLHKP